MTYPTDPCTRRAKSRALRTAAGYLAAAALTLSTGPVVRAEGQRGHASPSDHDKLDRRLHAVAEQRDGRAQRVIIRARPGQRRYLESLLEAHGDSPGVRFSSTESFAATVHGDDLALLTALDAVERISSDVPVHVTDGRSVSSSGGLTALRATLGLSDTWTGKGIGIAVIDSGVEASEDFGHRLAASYDFTGGSVSPIPDDYGHGTHVAGLAAGDGTRSNSGEFMGVAPKARLISLKVLDGNGAGRTSDVIAAIEFAVRHRAALRIHILNLSLGHPILEPAAEDPLVHAVENAVRHGLVVVVAAGNYGRSLQTGVPGFAGIMSPGNAPSAITVGAVDTRGTVSRLDDRVAPYSSRGPTWYDATAKPDLVAPGHDLGSTAAMSSFLYLNYPNLRISAPGGDYLRLSGTSMAVAVTSGVIADMLEANRDTNGSHAPALRPNAIKAVLQFTALSVMDHDGSTADALTAGAGSLNAQGAIDVARAIRTTTKRGEDWLDESLAPAQPATLIDGQWIPWSQTVVWGATILTGSTIAVHHEAWGAAVAWGAAKTVVWGTAKTVVWGTAKTVVWGTAKTVVWGTAKTVVWGTNVVWDAPDRWASTVVRGTTAIGILPTTGTTVVWGTSLGVQPDTVAWADLMDDAVDSADPGALTLDSSK